VAKIGWNSPHWFSRYGVHVVFRMQYAQTHRFTQSLMDGHIRKQYDSRIERFQWLRYKSYKVRHHNSLADSLMAYCSFLVFTSTENRKKWKLLQVQKSNTNTYQQNHASYLYTEYWQTTHHSPVPCWVFYRFEKMHVDSIHPTIKFTSY